MGFFINITRFRSLYDKTQNKGFESSHELRDILLATVDFSLHKVMVDLKHSGMMDNSVVLVTTDNGGGPWDSNMPLKGTKETTFEGGIRGASFLLSPLLSWSGYSYSGLLHISDWVPTLLALAGVQAPQGIDGKDVWAAISNNSTSPRHTVIHNIDQDPSKGTFQVKRHRTQK